MEPNCRKQNYGHLNSMDRLSDLPDFIIHHIISFLGSKEAYRTSVLSKRWSCISATNPVLEFHGSADLGYFDTRMQRYRKENLRIKKLCLMFSTRKVELKCKFDDWVEIAVRNQVSTLSIISDSVNYKLPAVLFTAKTLTRLYCSEVRIPYYNTLNFASLESLKLQGVVLEEPMLDHIITSCRLLKELCISDCTCFKNIVIPRSSLLERFVLTEKLSEGGAIILENSTLKEFSYIPKNGYGDEDPWPVISKRGALRNLKMLFISNVGITDKVLTELVSEVTSLESLVLKRCHMLNTIKILSMCIKDIRLNDCWSLMNVVIDAPSLKKFKFNDSLESAVSISITNNEPGCVISVDIPPVYLDTDGFVSFKKLLTGLNGRNSFKISLEYESSQECDLDIDEEELENISLGPPCDVEELKLCFSGWRLIESALSAFVNALFWICRPEIISLQIDLSVRNLTVEAFMCKLENLVKCCRHPLKHVKVEGIGSSSCLNSGKLYLRLRLFW